MGDNNHGLKWLRISFWCAAIVLGLVDAWGSRYNMNPDGISYLDLLLAIGVQCSFRLKSAAAAWPLLIIAFSALGLYLLLHLDYRFIAAFVCLLC